MSKWFEVLVITGLLSGLAFAQIQTDIYTIQSEMAVDSSLWLDSLVTVSGVVTASYGIATSVSFFLQMKPGGPWSGILVYTPEGQYSHVNVGDSLTVTATVDEYYGNTELEVADTANDIIYHGSVTPPDPVVLTCAYLDTTATSALPPDSAEAYEGVLVKLQGVFVTNTSPPTAGFEVTDGSGYVIVYNNYSYTPNIGDNLNVTGVVHTHYDYYKVRPRSIDDYEFLNPGISAAYSVSRENIDIIFKTQMDQTAEDPSKYYIIDSTGAQLSVLSAVRDTDDAHLVHLATATMEDAMPYQLSTPGLQDAGGNPVTDTVTFYGGFTPISLIESDTLAADSANGYRTNWMGRVVTITGVITGEKDVWLYPFFFVQQGEGPWTGIQIWDAPGVASPTVRGDSVIIVGEVTEYNGTTTEIQNLLYYHRVGSVTPPQPYITTINNLLSSAGPTSESFEGVLVRVENAVVTDPGTGGDWTVAQIVGSDTFYLTVDGYYATGYTVRPNAGDIVNVQGILRMIGVIYPRDDADVEVVGIDEGFNTVKRTFRVISPAMGKIDIEFAVSAPTKAELTMYNIMGQKVMTILSSKVNAGTHRIKVDAENLPQGIYFINLRAGSESLVRKVTLVK
ncbi:MAG TPA: T9SS type A sorting domain-containing protein [candidate division WOR-3 bacterium]|uniref:T9SS type A sorting domain-containing protein n=1 Tax=candidate division WOR-3 bacterium TaxID=2052148 RepID=A0A7V5HNF3_UNCW3|nr:T9SS type A sorting domain-containing protein [candidate division WOR-3 bacterium]